MDAAGYVTPKDGERYLNPILYLVRSTGFCMVVMRAA